MVNLSLDRLMVVFLTLTNALSPDCSSLIQLAKGLGMQSKQPTIWSTLQLDCCYGNGVLCVNTYVLNKAGTSLDVVERVSELRWAALALNGTINGTALPSLLEYLDLSRNELNGSIPLGLPTGLKTLWVNINQLNGSLPAIMPNALLDLRVFGNKLNGNLSSLPLTLVTVMLGFNATLGNRFHGALKLNKPQLLYINDNLITDVLIQDNSTLNICDLSNNPLLGNLNIKNLTKCVKNGLYSADLLSSTTASSLIVTTYVEIGFATTTTMPVSTTTTSSPLKSSTMSSSISPTPTSTATSSTFSSSLTSKSSTISPIAMATFVPKNNKTSSDCAMLVQFAKYLGMQKKQLSVWTNLQGNCCYADGVTCKDIIVQNNVTLQVVSELRWKGLALNGSLNGTVIPAALKYLDLSDNQLSGEIPPSLPSTLATLWLNNNQLTGGVPLRLPNSLKSLYLHLNLLSGGLPIFPDLQDLRLYGNKLGGNIGAITFPQSIDTLMLGFPEILGNQFEGTLRVYRPQVLLINDNLITDVFILDNLDRGAIKVRCDLSNNPLRGKVEYLSECVQNGMFIINDVLFGCQDIVKLGLGLGIKSVQPSIWAVLIVDCCLAEGIYCTKRSFQQITIKGVPTIIDTPKKLVVEWNGLG